MNGWCALVEGDERYVWPLKDMREHDIKSCTCWCKPFWDGDILVHNAGDGRTAHETRVQ